MHQKTIDPNQELIFENIKMFVLPVRVEQSVEVKVGVGVPAQNKAMFFSFELRGGEDLDDVRMVRTDPSQIR